MSIFGLIIFTFANIHFVLVILVKLDIFCRCELDVALLD